MMKSSVVMRNTVENSRGRYLSISVILPLIAMMFALLFGGMLGTFDTSKSAFVLWLIITAVVIILRHDELAVTLIAAAHIYIDWYLGLEVVGMTCAVVLLCIFFLARSSNHPWVAPRVLSLWGLFLVLTIAPVLQGFQGLYDLAYYYPNIIFGALIIFWLGSVVASNKIHLRTLFKWLAALATLLAIHTLIQSRTGVVLFGSTRFDALLARVSDYALANSTVQRAGSFFENPDWNGTFFAMMLFVPVGLFAQSISFLEKLLYVAEILLIIVALLATYSNGAWLAAFGGLIVFILLVGNGYYRIFMPFMLAVIIAVVIVSFPSEIALQFQHATSPVELSLRSGAWQTAIHVISAFPLTGVGLGLYVYIQRAEPYRVPTQYLPLAHPHNSYLELGAMAGLPVMLVFIALLLFALWLAWRNWLLLDARTRSLIAGGIAAVTALSINSLSINGWTLPPLAGMGWLILGAIASPLLIKKAASITTKNNA